MSEPNILVRRDGAVVTLTLNRPAALNAFNSAMHQELLAALNEAAENTQVRTVVMTGAGRAFCAGQDLADPAVGPQADGTVDLGAIVERHYAPLVERLQSMPIPIVAAVNGVAAGAGANLALACDIVLAARSASFIQAFGRIGLVPDTAGTWLLPRLVGRARALGLVLLGDRLKAEEAQAMGLIWSCVDDGELASAVGALALRLAAMPVRALAATRIAIDAAQSTTIEAAIAREAQLQRELGRSADYREGVAAFSEKRAPVFGDR
jgi:2-(1,2-epoxy-1,2-dihydrophenyl)acetyl-CoA isomerase